ncbi:sugar phosphate isomerase/epimerase [Sphingomonas sp.]|uniref:sugar phosphate isomerase/epimerase family protein n=1 Tax=Sphingomonas sp. TaxID=28214 RepID=UPI0025F8E297|nr:sugar phosphate isomerase/epimerase family protein [Sphingomonas sp.]
MPFHRRDIIAGGAAVIAAGALPSLSSRAVAATAARPVDLFSRHLQWLRSAEELAVACHAMGFDGLDITVRPFPGHVDPARVAQDLPPLVKALRAANVGVRTITAPIADAASPHAEAILETAASLGIHHYWWGGLRYDLSSPIAPQRKALAPRIAGIARLGEKYGMKAMYHNFSGAQQVGSMIFDLLDILQDFDPRYVSFHYDTAHGVEAGANGTWPLGLKAIGPYLGGISFKDVLLTDKPAAAGEGGPPVSGRWRPAFVPLGEGMLDLPRMVQILGEIGFDGPIELQPEFPNGGADRGVSKASDLTLPQETIFRNMAKDLQTLRLALAGGTAPAPSK